MSLLSRIFSRAPAEKTSERAITYQIAQSAELVESPTRSGVTVSETSAIGISALWCGIRTISQDIGSLCPELYRQDADGIRYEVEEHSVAKLLDDPNPEMSRIVFFETLTAHALLWGNCYAEIERNGRGDPVALWIIHPRNVQLLRDSDGNIVYRVTVTLNNLDPQHEPGQQIYLKRSDVFHVPGLCLTGSGIGEKLLNIARETIGFGIATQRYGSAFFGNACRPGGVLTTAGNLSDNARENLRKSWATMHGGVDCVGKVAILEEGLNYTPFNLTNEQSQYKDIISWYVGEIARILVIPPHLLMDLADAKWANITEQNRDYLTRTLRPWLIKFASELERKLLSVGERKNLYIEFDTTTLLQADTTTRYAAYNVAITAGFLTVDEVRKQENLPPLPVKPAPAVAGTEAPELAPPTTEE